jgi:hypothetical protein
MLDRDLGVIYLLMPLQSLGKFFVMTCLRRLRRLHYQQDNKLCFFIFLRCFMFIFKFFMIYLGQIKDLSLKESSFDRKGR